MTFEEFAAERLPGVLRFAAVLTGDRALAEDLAQEVLIRAYSRWGTIGSLDRPEYYVRKMILHEFLHWRRREWRQIPSGAASDVDRRSAPDHAVSYAERDALFARIGKLPARQRAVLALRYYEGLSDTEIADLIGCKPGTVRGLRNPGARRAARGVERPAWSGTRIHRGEDLMPTEDDLRIGYRALERHTPDVADVLRAVYDHPRRAARPWRLPPRVPRRHVLRAGLVLGAAGAVTAVAVMAAVARGPATRATSLAGARELRTRWRTAIDTASGDILYAHGGAAPGGWTRQSPWCIPSLARKYMSVTSASGRTGRCSRTGSTPSRCPPGTVPPTATPPTSTRAGCSFPGRSWW